MRLITFYIVSIFSINTYSQTFNDNYFSVNCDYKFKDNIYMPKIIDGVETDSYVSSTNEDNSESGTVYNIQISHVSNIHLDRNAQIFLSQYQKNCILNGVEVYRKTYNGLQGLEYFFYINEVPTKSIIFLYSNRTYLLQVSSRTDLAKKFAEFKKCFILNK